MVPLVEKCLVSRHCCLTAKPKELLLTLRLRVFTDYNFLIYVEWYLCDVFKILVGEHQGKKALGSHILVIMLIATLETHPAYYIGGKTDSCLWRFRCLEVLAIQPTGYHVLLQSIHMNARIVACSDSMWGSSVTHWIISWPNINIPNISYMYMALIHFCDVGGPLWLFPLV